MRASSWKLHLLLVCLIFSTTQAAEEGVNQINSVQDLQRTEIVVPNILGMKTLKCDFHMHTIFSDGVVWPTVRVEEAWREGLDAIAITDHLEGQPRRKYVSGDHNAPFEIAQPAAKECGLMLIHAAEITRRSPEGHLNALFIQDANPLDTEDFMKAVEAAIKQNAFIQWNHPGGPGALNSVHEELFAKGWIHAIEVINYREWYSAPVEWALSKNVAITGNTDAHASINDVYDTKKGHRPMTLVFAKERDEASLQEAMRAGRTAAWCNELLFAKKEYLDALFQGAVVAKPMPAKESGRDKRRRVLLSNQSDFTLTLTSEPAGWGEPIYLAPRAAQVVPVEDGAQVVDVTVANWHPNSKESLVTKLDLGAK